MNENSKVGELVYWKRPLIAAAFEDTIEQVLVAMKQSNITAVAVCHHNQTDKHQEKFKGIVSTLDIVTFIAFGLFAVDKPKPSDREIEKAFSTPIGNLLGVHEEGKKLWMVEDELEVKRLLEVMAKGIHRVIVNMGDGTYRMCSQRDVVNFLLLTKDPDHQRCNLDLRTKLSVALSKCEMEGRELETMKLDWTALDGFRKMEQRGVPALAVVDDDGVLLDCLSASDLRGMTRETVTDILLPVQDFLRQQKSRQNCMLATLGNNDSIQEALMKFVVTRCHRLWRVDDSLKLKGIISLSDIIGLFYEATLTPPPES